MKLIDFFITNFPSPPQLLLGGPAALCWAYLCLSLAGWLKVKRRWRTGYTRKVFHFLIFTTACAVHLTPPPLGGLPMVCLFGGMTSLVILEALLRGDGCARYEAMARESDAPHRTWFIIAPYFATLVGGIAANVLFAPAAAFGYLVTGLGDAVGEPVGTRFGRHRYRVPMLFTRIPAQRSLEGSAAVWAVSLLAMIIVAVAMSGIVLTPTIFAWLLLISFICTIVEAVSPHGWDNALMQLTPAMLAHYWLLPSSTM